MPPKLPKGVADSAMNQRVDFKSDDDSILPRGGIDKVRACAVRAVGPVLLSMRCSQVIYCAACRVLESAAVMASFTF